MKSAVYANSRGSVRTCWVVGCDTTAANKKDKDCALMTFPTLDREREAWFAFTKQTRPMAKNMFMCSKHFRNDDILRGQNRFVYITHQQVGGLR